MGEACGASTMTECLVDNDFFINDHTDRRLWLWENKPHECHWCRVKLNFTGKNGLTTDHYIPTSKGGSNHTSNLVPSCYACNQAKKDLLPEEFFLSKRHPSFDPAKLDIREGVIHYKIRQQDGSFQEMTVKDTPDMRRFVTWVQSHD